MVMHSGSYGFPDGIPGICDECFRADPDAVRYYCSHSGRLAIFKDGYWETYRDVKIGDVEPESTINLDTTVTQQRSPR